MLLASSFSVVNTSRYKENCLFIVAIDITYSCNLDAIPPTPLPSVCWREVYKRWQITSLNRACIINESLEEGQRAPQNLLLLYVWPPNLVALLGYSLAGWTLRDAQQRAEQRAADSLRARDYVINAKGARTLCWGGRCSVKNGWLRLSVQEMRHQ